MEIHVKDIHHTLSAEKESSDTSSRSSLILSRDNFTRMKQSSARKTSSMYSEIWGGNNTRPCLNHGSALQSSKWVNYYRCEVPLPEVFSQSFPSPAWQSQRRPPRPSEQWWWGCWAESRGLSINYSSNIIVAFNKISLTELILRWLNIRLCWRSRALKTHTHKKKKSITLNNFLRLLTKPEVDASSFSPLAQVTWRNISLPDVLRGIDDLLDARDT